MRKLLFGLLTLSIFSCTESKDQQLEKEEISKVDSSLENRQDTVSKIIHVYDTIDKNIGFIGLSDSLLVIDPTVSLFNLDKTKFKSFKFSKLNDHKDLAPYAYHADYYLLWFRCRAKNPNYYTIIINETNGKEKLVQTGNKNLQFLSWEQLIRHCFCVDFDLNSNPLRVEPKDESETVAYNNDEFYFPVEIEQEWLKVKWGSENNWKFAWIRWRKGNLFLLELNFID